jgi:alpha-tubulin suppressor-like RCC1 family protein
VSSLSSSGYQTCGVVSGGVRCWGSNQNSQLGDGTSADRYAPVTVFGLSGATSVEVGSRSACARRTDGTLRCWGDRSSGGLGSAPIAATPRPVQTFGF